MSSVEQKDAAVWKQTGSLIGGVAGPMSMTERLEAQRDSLKAQLEKVEAALEAIRKSPDVEAAVNAISRLGGYI